jgi:hypothetical protein
MDCFPTLLSHRISSMKSNLMKIFLDIYDNFSMCSISIHISWVFHVMQPEKLCHWFPQNFMCHDTFYSYIFLIFVCKIMETKEALNFFEGNYIF